MSAQAGTSLYSSAYSPFKPYSLLTYPSIWTTQRLFVVTLCCLYSCLIALTAAVDIPSEPSVPYDEQLHVHPYPIGPTSSSAIIAVQIPIKYLDFSQIDSFVCNFSFMVERVFDAESSSSFFDNHADHANSLVLSPVVTAYVVDYSEIITALSSYAFTNISAPDPWAPYPPYNIFSFKSLLSDSLWSDGEFSDLIPQFPQISHRFTRSDQRLQRFQTVFTYIPFVLDAQSILAEATSLLWKVQCVVPWKNPQNNTLRDNSTSLHAAPPTLLKQSVHDLNDMDHSIRNETTTSPSSPLLPSPLVNHHPPDDQATLRSFFSSHDTVAAPLTSLHTLTSNLTVGPIVQCLATSVHMLGTTYCYQASADRAYSRRPYWIDTIQQFWPLHVALMHVSEDFLANYDEIVIHIIPLANHTQLIWPEALHEPLYPYPSDMPSPLAATASNNNNQHRDVQSDVNDSSRVSVSSPKEFSSCMINGLFTNVRRGMDWNTMIIPIPQQLLAPYRDSNNPSNSSLPHLSLTIDCEDNIVLATKQPYDQTNKLSFSIPFAITLSEIQTQFFPQFGVEPHDLSYGPELASTNAFDQSSLFAPKYDQIPSFFTSHVSHLSSCEYVPPKSSFVVLFQTYSNVAGLIIVMLCVGIMVLFALSSFCRWVFGGCGHCRQRSRCSYCCCCCYFYCCPCCRKQREWSYSTDVPIAPLSHRKATTVDNSVYWEIN